MRHSRSKIFLVAGHYNEILVNQRYEEHEPLIIMSLSVEKLINPIFSIIFVSLLGYLKLEGRSKYYKMSKRWHIQVFIAHGFIQQNDNLFNLNEINFI